MTMSNVGYLTLDELKVVQNSIWDARAKWFNLGVQLNVKPTSLEAIQQYDKDPDNCITKVLTVWLKQSNPRPTWSSLVVALKQQTDGLEELADRIERQHLKHTTSGNEESHANTAIRLGKRPHQNDSESSAAQVTDDDTPIKKQKIDSDSAEQDPDQETEPENPSTAARLGKHYSQCSDDKGPNIKRRKPNKE